MYAFTTSKDVMDKDFLEADDNHGFEKLNRDFSTGENSMN